MMRTAKMKLARKRVGWLVFEAQAAGLDLEVTHLISKL